MTDEEIRLACLREAASVTSRQISAAASLQQFPYHPSQPGPSDILSAAKLFYEFVCPPGVERKGVEKGKRKK